MQSQGLVPGLKCRLIISAFFTFPSLLDYHICVKDIIVIVLLLKVVGRWEELGEWGWWFINVRV